MDDHDLQSGFAMGAWQVFPLRGELARGDDVRHVEPKVMDVLTLLARHAGEVVERDTIISEVWRGRFVSDDPLSKCVAELRKMLGDSAREPRYIRTVHKRGYQLVAPVTTGSGTESADKRAAEAGATTRSKRPVPGLLAIIVALVAVLLWQFVARDPAPKPALTPFNGPVLAVLPFGGGDPDDRYLVDGLRNELVTKLAARDAWRVVAKSSADRFADPSRSARDIAAALGVTNTLEGDVLRIDDQVRINVRLIDAISGEHVWAETYERDLTVANLFSVQRQIVDRVAMALEVTLSDQPQEATQAMPTASLSAYTAYLRGRRAAAAESVESLTEAVAEFRRAIELDPDFALAHAAAADAYLTLGAYFWGGLSVDESIDLAQPLLERAQQLDPGIAEAYATTGLMHMVQYDAESAEQSFRRAIEIQPSYARVYQLMGHLRWNQGRRDEAIDYTKQALDLDRWSGAINLDLARYYDKTGRFQEAMEEYVRVVNIEPDNAFAPLYIGALKYLAFGDVVGSVVWYHDAATRDRASPSVQAVPAMAYLELGDMVSAAAWIERGMALDPDNFFPRVSSLLFNVRNGNRDAALADARALHGAYGQSRNALRVLMEHDIEAGTPGIALARYSKAHPELTETELPQINAENVFAAVDIARLLILLGERDRADTLLDAALAGMDAMNRLGTDGYWISDVRALALQGRTELALAALRRAVDEGWRVHTWYHFDLDPALASLRDDPAFVAIRTQVMTDLAEQAVRLEQLKDRGELAFPVD